jgi:hypothetical protein
MTNREIDIRHFVLSEANQESMKAGKDLIFSQPSTINSKLFQRGHSSVGRAPALQAGSQGFESPCLHFRAAKMSRRSLAARDKGRGAFNNLEIQRICLRPIVKSLNH